MKSGDLEYARCGAGGTPGGEGGSGGEGGGDGGSGGGEGGGGGGTAREYICVRPMKYNSPVAGSTLTSTA